MATNDIPLVLRPMRAERRDLELFSACFDRNDAPRAFDSLEWQYFRNPTGEILVDLALLEGEERVAAIYATLPVHARINGKRRLATQSLDTLTDAEFRGRGLFIRLANATFARAESQGTSMIFGFPNGNSAHGFFTKLGWSRLDPVPFLVRPLRTAYVARRLPGIGRWIRWLPDIPLLLGRSRFSRSDNVRSISRFGVESTTLWNEFSRDVRVAVDRDAQYLNWRLIDKPHERYTNLGWFEGETLTAFVSFTVKEKHGGRVGYVMELLHRPGRVVEASVLLHLALEQMADDRADVALAWCLPHSPNHQCFRRLGFFVLPERLRPIELHFGVRAFDSFIATTVSERRSWYVSYLDSDTV